VELRETREEKGGTNACKVSDVLFPTDLQYCSVCSGQTTMTVFSDKCLFFLFSVSPALKSACQSRVRHVQGLGMAADSQV